MSIVTALDTHTSSPGSQSAHGILSHRLNDADDSQAFKSVMEDLDHSTPTPLLRNRLDQTLASRAYPKTACPSEIARRLPAHELKTLGMQHWRDAMEPLRQLIQSLRLAGQVEVLQHGVVIQDDIAIADLKGPIRVRRTINSQQDSDSGF